MGALFTNDSLAALAPADFLPVGGFLPNGSKSDLICVEMDELEFNGLLADVAIRKDREAFKALFEHFAPRVKTYLIKRGLGAQPAEDLAQDTMVRVWRKAETFDPARSDASAWIFSIARNLSIDLFRRNQRMGIVVELPEELESAEKPDELVLGSQYHERVAKAIKTLPAEQLQLVKLAFFEDKSHGEIASILDIPLGTIKSRLRLAYAKLRNQLVDLQ
jgi:RNA polymerase sigma-70 factor (ECF subfamily)